MLQRLETELFVGRWFLCWFSGGKFQRVAGCSCGRVKGAKHATIALTGGVPLELVQKVTGHKTTDIVLKHYFQPGREDFRMALQSAMPNLLTNGHKTPKEEMREMLNEVKPKALRERLLKVWEKW